MSSTPEIPNPTMSPSELALAEFRKRVQADGDVPANIRAAVAKDTEATSPAALANLRAALSPKGASDAA